MSYVIQGVFAEDIKNFVTFKRSLGYDYFESERILCRFQDFCNTEFPDQTVLNKELVLKWSEKRKSESNEHRLNRISVVREFAKYLNSVGKIAYLIPSELTAKTKGQRHIPHIYTHDELAKIFKSIDETPKSPWHPAIHLIAPVIYRLIYTCGLRPIEARRLQVKDINLDTGAIKILESKGHKDRMVMLSDDMRKLCQKYDEKINLIYPNRIYFFHSNKSKGMFSEPWISRIFKEHLISVELDKVSGNTPRLYDLRHTFATHKLYEWIKNGKDINVCLPYLSEYMGHSVLSDTAYYIHLVPEFYPQMTQLGMDDYGKLITEVDYENA